MHLQHDHRIKLLNGDVIKVSTPTETNRHWDTNGRLLQAEGGLRIEWEKEPNFAGPVTTFIPWTAIAEWDQLDHRRGARA